MIDYEYRAGAIVQDPELRFTPNSGTSCLNLRLGQSASRYNDQSGQWERTKEHYFDVVVWPQRRGDQTIDLPTLANNLLRRGMNVAVRGQFQTRKYVNKRGDDVYVTEFVADRIHIDVTDLADDTAQDTAGEEEPPWMRDRVSS